MGALNFGSDRGAQTATQKQGSFDERFFLKKDHLVRKSPKWGHMVRIRQILANFQGKIQIWKHCGQKFRKKKIVNFDDTFEKKESFHERLSKIGCEMTKKGGHWMRSSQEKGSMSELKKKVNVAMHPHHQILVSAPQPPAPSPLYLSDFSIHV